MARASASPQELTALRRKLHTLAEMSGREEQTAAFLQAELAKCEPADLVTGLGGQDSGGNGLAAVFAGRDPGPTVLLRCDMDALPLPDRSDLPHASLAAGVSHKCGHDGHMTMMLGLAHQLAANPPVRGRAVLLFQPAEETGAGARQVLDDPAFKPLTPDVVLGVHNLPGYPLGAVILRAGPFAAASRGLTIALSGASSHAAEPEAGRSPALAAASLVQALSALPQTATHLGEGAKVTVVGIDVGGPAFGTSPGTGRVMATLRAYRDEVMDRLAERCAELATHTAAAFGLESSLSWCEAFPSTVNAAPVIAAVAAAAGEAGLPVIHSEAPFAWSEDFGHFTATYPGALVGLGAGVDHPALHHPDYDFPDPLLPAGVTFWGAALDRLLAQPFEKGDAV